MRKKRQLATDAIYHATARINRQELIFDTELLEFKKMFAQFLSLAQKKYMFKLYNFVIMGNHVHLQIEPANGMDLPRIMQWVLSCFAKSYNRYFGYKGHVWYDRYKSRIINTVRHFVNTFLYIAANPVRARLCDDPLSWKFNGVRYLCSKEFDVEKGQLKLEVLVGAQLQFLLKMLQKQNLRFFARFRKAYSI